MRLYLLFLIAFSFLSDKTYSQEDLFGAIPISEEEYAKIPKISFDDSDKAAAGISLFHNNNLTSYSLEEFVPPVKSQVGSTCTGFAFIYYSLSTQYNYQFNIRKTVDKIGHSFDPYFIYTMLNSSGNSCSSGNYMMEVLSNLNNKGAKKRFFAPFLKCYSNNNYNKYKEYTLPYSLSSYSSFLIDSNLSTNVKKSLRRNKPVVIALYVTDSFAFNINEDGFTYKGDYAFSRNFGFYHAVSVIGYDDSKYGGSFRVVNSWGKDWGDDGYFWISYENFNRFVREAYVMNLSSNLNINNNPQLKADSYERKLYESDETYEGQVNYKSEPEGYGIYSFNDEGERINVIGKWDDDDDKNGHFILIDETDIYSLVYKNNKLVETELMLGFTGSDDENIDQNMFLDYWASYGEKERPRRRKSKRVIIKRLKNLIKQLK